MGISRPVAKQLLNASTSTGTTVQSFGEGYRHVSMYISNPSTKAFVNSIEVSIGDSGIWGTVLGAATSTGSVIRTSTGGMVFDRARINVSSNATTAGVTVWTLVSD